MRDAEDEYLRLTLESCDIIDLANLPEDDRHLATRNLELRRLYVALRVWVEHHGQDTLADSTLAQIERRHDLLRLHHAQKHVGTEALAQMGLDLPVEQPYDVARRQRVPIGQRLEQARRLVVLGDPGAGKSTMLRWIATAYLLRQKAHPDLQALPDADTLPDHRWRPILVRCRDLSKPQIEGSLDDILLHTLRKAELSPQHSLLLKDLLRDDLHCGRALLLVDGLDEVADPAARARLCEQIERVRRAHPRAPLIVTSRIVGYRQMGYRFGDGFEHVTIADLSKDDKDDFARRWCQLTVPPPVAQQEADARELIRDIHSAERIERLTTNPMLLTTMALVKRKIGKLPSRRADLYSQAIKVLLNWRKELDEPIDPYEALPQLQYVAFAMCERGLQRVSEVELLDLIDRMREEYPNIRYARARSPAAFVKLLEERTGILAQAGYTSQHGWEVPVYEFRHLTLQEYLAGLALLQGKKPNHDRRQPLTAQLAALSGSVGAITPGDGPLFHGRETFREPIRLCIAACDDDRIDDFLLAVLRTREGEDPSTTAEARTALAALCLADEPDASEAVVAEILEALASYAVNLPEEGRERSAAVQAAANELRGSCFCTAFHHQLIRTALDSEPKARLSLHTLVVDNIGGGLPEETDKLLSVLEDAAKSLWQPSPTAYAIPSTTACSHWAKAIKTPTWTLFCRSMHAAPHARRKRWGFETSRHGNASERWPCISP